MNLCLIMFRITISCNLKLPVFKNYMNFEDTVVIYNINVLVQPF